MNELRVPDLLDWDLDTMDSAMRQWMRPWRFDVAERAPKIRIDLTEDEKTYMVKAEIPGVRKEDIDVRIDGNQVTISAEVKKDTEETKGRTLRRERQYGYASRTFTLASAVDDAHADAKYTNGVLDLKLPKRTTTTAKKLAVA